MFDKIDLHNTLILAFFAFLGGLTRELNDIISNKLRVKSFVIGLVTASTTGIIISQALLEAGISLRLACFLTGIAGFMGPYVLLALSRILERKLIAFGSQTAIDAFHEGMGTLEELPTKEEIEHEVQVELHDIQKVETPKKTKKSRKRKQK